MALHQNITLKMDKNLLQKAKVFAAGRKTSLSRLMMETLRDKITQSEGYQRAQKGALALLKKGFKLGGGPYYASRDELHSRHG